MRGKARNRRATPAPSRTANGLAPWGLAQTLSPVVWLSASMVDAVTFDKTSPMQLTVQLPDELARQLGPESQMPRRILEAVVLQRYLAEEISLGRLAELLGVSRWEAEAFLDRHNARLPYTREMLEEDRRNLAQLFGRS